MAHSIGRVLVPVDFSDDSSGALDYARLLARQFGGRVDLLHVVEDPFATGAWSAEAYVVNLTELLQKLVTDAQTRLQALAAQSRTDDVPVDATVISGLPAHAIVEHAQNGGYDLIVMGTHGRTGLAHALMGSVAERVLRKAPCPVLTVRNAPPSRAR